MINYMVWLTMINNIKILNHLKYLSAGVNLCPPTPVRDVYLMYLQEADWSQVMRKYHQVLQFIGG